MLVELVMVTNVAEVNKHQHLKFYIVEFMK